MERRADLEWSNTWIDKANLINLEKSNSSGGRILLIGDSVIRMARSNLADIENVPVDMIASSYNLDDPLFIGMIDNFFASERYNYEVVFVQISHHGSGLQEEHLSIIDRFSPEYYDRCMRGLVSFLEQYCSNIILVHPFEFYLRNNDYSHYICPGKLFRFLTKYGIVKQKKDIVKNIIVSKRKEIIEKIARERNHPVLDLETKISKYSHIIVDSIHPENKMKPKMAKEMSVFMHNLKII